MLTKIIALALVSACSAPVLAEPLPVLVVPHALQAPRMTAAPDDPAWKRAASIKALTPSIALDEKPPPTLPAQVLALWDKKFLYVRFVCEDGTIDAPFQKRDAPHYQGDVAEVFLDPVGDGQHYFEMELSPRGGIFDQYIALTASPRCDEYGRLLPEVIERDFWPNPAWNCEGLRTATRILSRNGRTVGWIAELALPAKAVLQRLGKDHFEPQTLRANFLRYDWKPSYNPKVKDRKLMALNWSSVVLGCPHISPGRMGFLRLQAAK